MKKQETTLETQLYHLGWIVLLTVAALIAGKCIFFPDFSISGQMPPMRLSSSDRIFLSGMWWNQICESTAFRQISGMCRRLSDGFLCDGSIFLVYVQPEY